MIRTKKELEKDFPGLFSICRKSSLRELKRGLKWYIYGGQLGPTDYHLTHCSQEHL